MAQDARTIRKRLIDLKAGRYKIESWLKGEGDVTVFTRAELIKNCPLGEWVAWDDGVNVLRRQIDGDEFLITEIARSRSSVKWTQDTLMDTTVIQGSLISEYMGKELNAGEGYTLPPGSVDQWRTDSGCVILSKI